MGVGTYRYRQLGSQNTTYSAIDGRILMRCAITKYLQTARHRRKNGCILSPVLKTFWCISRCLLYETLFKGSHTAQRAKITAFSFAYTITLPALAWLIFAEERASSPKSGDRVHCCIGCVVVLKPRGSDVFCCII